MASISEKQRKNLDRISNLPDNLIAHILSFLSTKDAVKTSVLSTYWNQQWTLVPLIRFDDKPRCSQSFVNFVYRVLLYKVTPLDLFQLSKGMFNAKDVSNWISVALSRHVREIDVHASMPTHYFLPDGLYSNTSLVVLKLKGYFVFQVPEKISLECLKIFHCEAGDSEDGYNAEEVGNYDFGESISKLVSSCPVLEELKISGIFEETLRVLNITSLALKRLILKDLYQDDARPHPYKLLLNTPNLQYLEQSDELGVPDTYEINTLQCLDTARFSFDLNDYIFGHLAQARPLAELVVAISNVRVLHILRESFATLKNIVYSSALPNFELPKFERLVCLELGYVYSNAGLRFLIAFLRSSRQLESLSFYLGCPSDDYWSPPYETWYPPTDVPFCMIYNLKVITVDFYDEEELVLNVLTYFLKKTNCLEELILHPRKKEEDFIKKLSMLPRASKSCRIVLT